MCTSLQDVAYAARRLMRAPLFTAAAVAIVAVGIGANATAFGLVDAVLLRSPPFERPEEVVSIFQHSDDGVPSPTAAYPAYLDMAAMTDVFAAVGAVSPAFETVQWETLNGVRDVAVEYATASYLPMLGLGPSRGRWFAPEHDQVGAGGFAVVSHRSWRTLMGGDPNAIGSTIRLNGQPITVIGVGPERFNGWLGAVVTDFWLSISSTFVGGPSRVANLERREDHWYGVKARLAPGVTVERARAAMDALALRLGEAFPELDAGRGITVFAHDEVRFDPEVDGTLLGAGAGLLAVVGLTLILACANLANLILVRGVSRTPEIALRRALGASASRVTRLVIVESLVLAALGGAAGLLLTAVAVDFVPLLLPVPGGATFDVVVDRRVIGFGLILTLATGVVFGLAPALLAAGADVAGALREQSRSALSGRCAVLARNALVGVQVAVSLVLVLGAGLLGRSFAAARAVDPGFGPSQLALVATNLLLGSVSNAEAPAVRREIVERIRAVPGVTHAALVSRLPVQPGGTTTTVVEGYEPPSGTGAIELAFTVVGEEYFEALGVPLIAGSTFGPDDRVDAPRVVVVNKTTARRFWGGDALDRRLRPQGAPDAWRRVIGVVGDVKVASVQEAPTPMFYYSAEQFGLSAFNVVVRTEGDPASLIGPLRATLREVDSALPLTRLTTMEAHLGSALAGPRTAARRSPGPAPRRPSSAASPSSPCCSPAWGSTGPFRSRWRRGPERWACGLRSGPHALG